MKSNGYKYNGYDLHDDLNQMRTNRIGMMKTKWVQIQ